MATSPAKGAIRYVKPLLSNNEIEARRRVIALYKSWFRFIPVAVIEYGLSRPASYFRKKLREEFLKHQNVKDIRVIDMLVVKGEQHLRETTTHWKQTCHVMYMFQDTALPRPNTFLSKFLSGVD